MWFYEADALDLLEKTVPATLARGRMPLRWYRRAIRDAMKAGKAGALRYGFANMAEVEPAERVMAEFLAEHAPDHLPVKPDASHGEICDKARMLAADIVLRTAGLSLDDALVVCQHACEHHGVDLPDVKVPKADSMTEAQRETAKVAGQVARVRCERWWRRRLRTTALRALEHSNIRLHFVHVRADAYASNDAVRRRVAQNRRNAAALANTTLENEDGDQFSLAELAEKSVANKALRRGEFMTRLRGMEDLADAAGFGGVMFTLTCPSRFHAVTHGTFRGNPRYDDSDPRKAQRYLCKVWQRIRAKLGRMGVVYFGMRVAEPHHDSCPHWHGLIFSNDVPAVCAVIREHGLKDSPDEPGAQERRVDFEVIDKAKGSAVAYLSKYISKNIDGHGVGDHKTQDGFIVTTDLLGDTEITPSQRVDAWVATWGVRQFQQFGGAPVGVWRELRRVKVEDLPEESEAPAIHAGWRAVQKTEDHRADWAEYARAMGGVAGEQRRIAIRYTERIEPGRYGLALRKVPHGVTAIGRYRTVDGIADYYRVGPVFVPSARHQWRVVERSGAAASTRTRVNNCTRPAEKPIAEQAAPIAKRYETRPSWLVDLEKADHATPEVPQQRRKAEGIPGQDAADKGNRERVYS